MYWACTFSVLRSPVRFYMQILEVVPSAGVGSSMMYKYWKALFNHPTPQGPNGDPDLT
jgi:hypothetical protein